MVSSPFSHKNLWTLLCPISDLYSYTTAALQRDSIIPRPNEENRFKQPTSCQSSPRLPDQAKSLTAPRALEDCKFQIFKFCKVADENWKSSTHSILELIEETIDRFSASLTCWKNICRGWNLEADYRIPNTSSQIRSTHAKHISITSSCNRKFLNHFLMRWAFGSINAFQ